MKTTKWIVAVAVGVLGCAVLKSERADPELVVKDGARERRFEIAYAAKLTAVPAGAQRLRLWLPVPRSSEDQHVEVSFSGPVSPEFHSDAQFGNRIAYYELAGDALAPCEFMVRAQVRRVERLHEVDGSTRKSDPVARDLEPDALGPIDGEPAAIARSAVGDEKDSVQRAERLYRTVLDRMRYDKTGEGWGRGDVAFACREGRGNCSDFHSLFIAMARSLDIPSRFVMGFPLPPEHGEGEVKGYHCWAEFHVDGVGWVPVDASEADKHPELADYYFGSLTADRVAFTCGRDIQLDPPQTGPRLNFFIDPYAELDGKPFTGIERHVTYRDL